MARENAWRERTVTSVGGSDAKSGTAAAPLEHTPPAVLGHRLSTLLLDGLCLPGAHLINGLVHLRHDVNPVEHMQRPRNARGDHVEVGLPHVRAHVADLHGAPRPRSG